MLRKLYDKLHRRAFPSLEYYLVKLTRPFGSLVDFGCGPTSPLRYLPKEMRTLGIDASEECVRLNKTEGIFSDYIIADVTQTKIPDKSYDVAVSLDVLNLLDKEKGQVLINEMERVARKRVIILCPNGQVEEPPEIKSGAQSTYKSDYQFLQYRSAWTAKEMKLQGYKVIGINGLKWLRHGNARPRIRPTFLGVLISDATQLITRFFPSLAFHLLCYKELMQKS